MLDFRVGDKVVHWNFGFGEIIGKEEKLIHDRKMQCFVVEAGDLTIWVTADDPNVSSLRSPTPESDFEGLFDILKSPGEPLPVDRFDRKTDLAARMKDGRLVSICSVIRDLIFLRREKKLNENDKSTLERAQNFLLTEWVFSLAVPKLQARDEMLKLLEVT